LAFPPPKSCGLWRGKYAPQAPGLGRGNMPQRVRKGETYIG